MSRRLLAIAFVAFFLSFASAQLRTAITSASVEGTVVTMPENRPVARAVVVLQPADEEETPQNRLITDADGHFLFKGLKPGRYSLHCGRQGLVAYADRDQFQELALVADQQLNGIVLRFVVGGVVTGRVFDKEGEPLQDVKVFAQPYRKRRRAYRAGGARTDDRGEYRLYDLEPGPYYVVAVPRGGVGFAEDKSALEKGERYVSTYYPGTVDRGEAEMISLQSGQEAVADFKLVMAHTVLVSGIVTGLPAKANFVSVMLEPREEALSVEGGVEAGVRNGKFELYGVLPGKYFLGATAADESGEHPVGTRQEINVPEQGLRGLHLVLSPPATLSGRIVSDSGVPKAGYSALRVAFTSSERDDESIGLGYFNNGGSDQVKSDGTFRLSSLRPGAYFPQITASDSSLRDWYLSSVQVGTQDVTDTGVPISSTNTAVVLHISSAGASLSGRVIDAEKHPVPNVTVVAIPPPARRKRYDLYQNASTDQNGNFVMRGMAPGGYLLLAGEDLDVNDWFDADAPHQYENFATRVDLRAQEQKTITISALVPSGEE